MSNHWSNFLWPLIVTNSVNTRPLTVGLAIFLLPDANSLETADEVNAKMAELARDFPEDFVWEIGYDTTPFIRQSIKEVFWTLADSVESAIR